MNFKLMPTGIFGLHRRMRAGRAMPCLASFALLAALGWQGVRMTPLLWPASEPALASQQSRAGADRSSANSHGMQADERLARLHLFGIHSPDPETGKPESEPETKLDLTLKGVYAPYGDSGVAVIELGSGEESVFAIGERVGGAAEVAQVLPGKIILRRNGHREVLSMYDEGMRPND